MAKRNAKVSATQWKIKKETYKRLIKIYHWI